MRNGGYWIIGLYSFVTLFCIALSGLVLAQGIGAETLISPALSCGTSSSDLWESYFNGALSGAGIVVFLLLLVNMPDVFLKPLRRIYPFSLFSRQSGSSVSEDELP